MKEVKWDSLDAKSSVHGSIGCISLHCCRVKMRTGSIRWYALVRICGLGNTRTSPRTMRHSLAKAKEDCISLAHETMLNYREGLKAELKNFDLAME